MTSLEVARRLERSDAEGLCRIAGFVAGLFPDLKIRTKRPAGGCLMVMGRGQVVNKVMGLGLEGPLDESVLNGIEEVFAAAGLDPEIEAWTGADPSLQVILEGRGYVDSGTLRVLAAGASVAPDEPDEPGDDRGIQIETVGATGSESYELTVARGFMDLDDGDPGLPARVFARAAAYNPRTTALLARIGGEPAGGGAMSTYRGSAAFFGASTLPRFRGRGIQSALLRRRVAIAREAGCDLMYIKTTLDSGSERNARRVGFRPALEKVIWRKKSRP